MDDDVFSLVGLLLIPKAMVAITILSVELGDVNDCKI